MSLHVLRVYHSGRDPLHRLRDRALVAAGIRLTLAVPREWPGDTTDPVDEEFDVVEFEARRPGDVNRHTWADPDLLPRLVDTIRPDLVDLHEEPVSAVVHQLSPRVDSNLPVVAYTAQNLDKRFPPPFAQWERQAFSRLWGIQACSNQALSVVRGKGYQGVVARLALGMDAERLTAGPQRADAPELLLGLVGRLVAEKGPHDALRCLATVNAVRPARLILLGEGPESDSVIAAAAALGLADRVELLPWTDGDGLAALYRRLHWVLVPSRATETWVEQFGRVVVEGQACGAVIGTYASGALPEVVGDTGLIVAEGDVDALATGILAAMDDGRWRIWRDRGLLRAPTFSWPAIAGEQLSFYERSVAAGPPRPPVRGARSRAVEEFGLPATAVGSSRPFALPVLRKDNAVTRALATTIDRLRPP